MRVPGHRLRFEFRGKGRKLHVVALRDRRLARRTRRAPRDGCSNFRQIAGVFQAGGLGPVVKVIPPRRADRHPPDLHLEERWVLRLLERTRKPAAG
ncbi:MAG TPA: hypothetical protein VIF59_02540 [Methylomirabilota bacterium]